VQTEASSKENHSVEIHVPSLLVPGIYFVKVNGDEEVSSAFKLAVGK